MDNVINITENPQRERERERELICSIPVYANYRICDRLDVDYARTVMARDYKGPGSSKQISTCIVEIWKIIKR